MSQHERKTSTIDEKKDYIREASGYLDSYAKVVIKRQVQIDERVDNGEFGKWLKKGFEKENPNYTIDVDYTNEDKVMNVTSKNLEAKLSISVNNGVKYNDEPIEDVLNKTNDDSTLGKISKLQKVAKNYMTEATHQISVRHDELRDYVKNFNNDRKNLEHRSSANALYKAMSVAESCKSNSKDDSCTPDF